MAGKGDMFAVWSTRFECFLAFTRHRTARKKHGPLSCLYTRHLDAARRTQDASKGYFLTGKDERARIVGDTLVVKKINLTWEVDDSYEG